MKAEDECVRQQQMEAIRQLFVISGTLMTISGISYQILTATVVCVSSFFCNAALSVRCSHDLTYYWLIFPVN
jgi:hypothetical protein